MPLQRRVNGVVFEKILPEEKLYFSIGEVARITGIKPHVLRYWEQEFPLLKPRKDESGRRIFRKKDIEAVFKIKKLLYEEKFTIPGARRALISDEEVGIDTLTGEKIADELRVILKLLKEV